MITHSAEERAVGVGVGGDTERRQGGGLHKIWKRGVGNIGGVFLK